MTTVSVMRLTVSRRTDLAIRAYRHLLTQTGRTSGKHIAAAVDTSVPFLSQVLAPLVAAGWLDSRTGPQGGYSIAEPGQTLSLLELVEAIEGPVIDGRCVLEGSQCDADPACAMHATWAAARTTLMRSLAEVSVADESPLH